MGYRLPVFDIKVSAQKKNVYTKVTQNELSLQFFQLGFFAPQMTDQALLCLDLMEFDGKDEVMQKVARNGTIYEKLLQYMQLALSLSEKTDPVLAEQIGADILATMGTAPTGGTSASLTAGGNATGAKEPANVERAKSMTRRTTEV